MYGEHNVSVVWQCLSDEHSRRIQPTSNIPALVCAVCVAQIRALCMYVNLNVSAHDVGDREIYSNADNKTPTAHTIYIYIYTIIHFHVSCSNKMYELEITAVYTSQANTYDPFYLFSMCDLAVMPPESGVENEVRDEYI